MAKNKQERKENQQHSTKIRAGHYTPSMVDFLGYDTVKNVYDSTIIAIEEAQHFSAEVRVKGLQTAALLGTLIIGIITAFCSIECSIESLFAKIVMVTIAMVLTNALRGIIRKVIYRKDNIHRGNTQSRLLSEQMINALHKVDKENRSAFVLASTLKTLEKSVELQNKNTEEKQVAYQQEIDTMTTLLSYILLFASIFAILFCLSRPLY